MSPRVATRPVARRDLIYSRQEKQLRQRQPLRRWCGRQFAIHPHLDYEGFPENSLTKLEKLAATIPVPSYLIDDQTAIKVIDGAVEVVSEGHWKLFTPSPSASESGSTLDAQHQNTSRSSSR